MLLAWRVVENQPLLLEFSPGDSVRIEALRVPFACLCFPLI